MIDTPLGEEIREGHCGWRSGDRPALVAKPTFSSTTAALHVYFGGSLQEIDALTRYEPPSLLLPELLSTAIPVPIVRSRFGGSKIGFGNKNIVFFGIKSGFQRSISLSTLSQIRRRITYLYRSWLELSRGVFGLF